MISLQQLQADFAAALFDPARPPPDGLRAGDAARLAIYRNNVHAGLAAVLEARYPVIRRLVGDAFFRALALAFLRRQPPRSPVLARYGGGFARFLRQFEPVRTLPYLPDMAALEWARHRAHHAADAATAAIADLAAVPAARLATTRLAVHPAASAVASAYPIVALWRTNTHDENVRPLGPGLPGETALITRPGLDVLVTALPPGGAALLSALRRGAPLAAAAQAIEPQTDLPRLLATLFDTGAIAGIDASP